MRLVAPGRETSSIPVDDFDGLRLQVITAQPGKLFVCDDMGRALARLAAVSGTDQAFELPLSLIQSQVVGLAGTIGGSRWIGTSVRRATDEDCSEAGPNQRFTVRRARWNR